MELNEAKTDGTSRKKTQINQSHHLAEQILVSIFVVAVAVRYFVFLFHAHDGLVISFSTGKCE